MKPESSPITDDEYLLRRVHRDRFRSDRAPGVSPNAFEPRVKGRDPDADGISLYREACVADATDILATIPEDKRSEYAIVRVPVALLKGLELTARSVPDDRIPGHVVIPELNAADYEADKTRFTPVKLALATAASGDDAVLQRPASLQTD